MSGPRAGGRSVRARLGSAVFMACVAACLGVAGGGLGGCTVVSEERNGFGQRVTGNAGIPLPTGTDADPDGANLSASDAFAPLPAPAPGSGEPLTLTLDAASPEPGDAWLVDVTAVVEITLRDASNDGTPTPEFSLADLRSQSAGVFTGRTVGRLRGRLAVLAVDDAGRMTRSVLAVDEAALVRDGEMLGRIPAGRQVRIERPTAGGRVMPGPPTLRLEGGELRGDIRRLVTMCLLDPLEDGAWTSWSRLADLEGPRRPGETWAIDDEAIARLLGLPPEGVMSPRGVARLTLEEGTGVRPAPAVIEIRTRAGSVVDDRILTAFGPSLAGLPDAASIHRVLATRIEPKANDPESTPPRTGWVRQSAVAHRFPLLDQRGPVDAERLERLQVRIVPIVE